MFSGEVVKAHIIINESPTSGSLGPKARIVTETGQVWWVNQGNDGMLEMSLRDTLTREELENEMQR